MTSDLDSLLPPDHNARAVWAYVLRLDLSSLYDQIKARGSHPGRPPIDPAVLMALWLFATLEGVRSARTLDRLCSQHFAYIWLCGGVSVNYHTLSDFRVAHAALLEKLLVDGVTALLAAGVVDMVRVAQDGVRVRASAGASSFKRRKTIEHARALAKEQVETLRKGDEDGGEASLRQHAAQERAAREIEERLDAALEKMAEVEKTHRPSKKKKTGETAPKDAPKTPEQREEEDKKTAPRVSVTDPEARVMKMADGGFRPAYNGQFATDVGTQIILGVDNVTIGSDKSQMEPMVDQIARHYGKHPQQYLVDNGFVKLDSIEKLESQGVQVIAPVQTPRDPTRSPHERLPGDGPGVAAWRERMGREEAKATYLHRGSMAECVNAIARNRGLQQYTVRGRLKTKAVLLWYALAHNLRRAMTLAPEIALGAVV